MTSYPPLRLLPSRHKRVAHGHPWIFSNEIQMDAPTKALPAGALVRVLTHDGVALGVASFNPHSLIAGRLFSRDGTAVIDQGFVEARLRAALALRDRLYNRPFYRLIHAEADGLPGLIVDRYGDVLVVQANSAGVDRLLPTLQAAWNTVLDPQATVLKLDSPARALEGLPDGDTTLTPDSRNPARVQDGLSLEENGGIFFADPLGGQKTGWFYDQRDNRAFIAALSSGARVIDLYTYHGGFAVQCARAGAATVVAVDRSEAALHQAARAASANGVGDRVSVRRAEVFAELERLVAVRERYEVVIADPPAFVKSRKDLQAGLRGYRKLAKLAATITAPGGFLLMGSCSHNVEPAVFAETVAAGLGDAGRSGRILRSAGAGPDHPVHPLLPESAYLKALVYQLD
ncbi:MAG: class I SAM-dependent rRNA methyltransferase [Azospirillaceae bacterium]|nr:class I SAM-dependent rRNA methyltransferase [Azospirillaceae bacterium]